MSSAADIKTIIAILCKELNFLFDCGLKPEHFRLAKFNKAEENIVPRLWSLLNQFFDGTTKLSPREIKMNMKLLKFPNHAFYNLPEDMSGGSRELILAVGYMINRHLYQFILATIENSPFGENFDISSNNETHDRAEMDIELPNFNSEKDVKEYMRWLDGRINFNKNLASEYDKQSVKIYEKLSNSLNFKTIEQLTKSEMISLYDAKYCQNFLDASVCIFQILETHSQWIKKEKYFWKWMISVVAERNK